MNRKEGEFMENLSNNALIKDYINAKKFGLAHVFLKKITDEMNNRGITNDKIEDYKRRHFNYN